MISFILGMIIGGVIGITVMSALSISGRGDEGDTRRR